MIHIISYASSEYYEHLRRRLLRDCNKFGLTNQHNYDRKWLETTQFYRNHRDVLDIPRGSGVWAWKSFIIADMLSKCAPYDIVCYLDASTTMKVDPTPVIESVEDVLVCDSSWRAADWTKRDCFHFMHCESDLYFNATQVWAGAVIIRNTEVGNDLVNDWLKYSCDRRIISDDKSVSGPELPNFRDGRHDQAILSNLIRKYIHEYEMTGVQTVPTMPFIDE